MDYITLAIEAKRKKDFGLAIKYYQKQIMEKGVSSKVLQSAAKAYYLNNQKKLALQFNLAAAHLCLRKEFEKFKSGDKEVREKLDALPLDKRNQFPHMIGDYLYYSPSLPKHVGHAYLDYEKTYAKEPEFREYAQIYFAQILSDGSADRKFEVFNINPSEFEQIEEDCYVPVGYKVLHDQIEWTKIESSDVLNIYIV